jgi:hypothetical protein
MTIQREISDALQIGQKESWYGHKDLWSLKKFSQSSESETAVLLPTFQSPDEMLIRSDSRREGMKEPEPLLRNAGPQSDRSIDSFRMEEAAENGRENKIFP